MLRLIVAVGLVVGSVQAAAALPQQGSAASGTPPATDYIAQVLATMPHNSWMPLTCGNNGNVNANPPVGGQVPLDRAHFDGGSTTGTTPSFTGANRALAFPDDAAVGGGPMHGINPVMVPGGNGIPEYSSSPINENNGTAFFFGGGHNGGGDSTFEIFDAQAAAHNIIAQGGYNSTNGCGNWAPGSPGARLICAAGCVNGISPQLKPAWSAAAPSASGPVFYVTQISSTSIALNGGHFASGHMPTNGNPKAYGIVPGALLEDVGWYSGATSPGGIVSCGFATVTSVTWSSTASPGIVNLSCPLTGKNGTRYTFYSPYAYFLGDATVGSNIIDNIPYDPGAIYVCSQGSGGIPCHTGISGVGVSAGAVGLLPWTMNGTFTSGSATITGNFNCCGGFGINPGDLPVSAGDTITGADVPSGTTVVSASGNCCDKTGHIVMSQNTSCATSCYAALTITPASGGPYKLKISANATSGAGAVETFTALGGGPGYWATTNYLGVPMPIAEHTQFFSRWAAGTNIFTASGGGGFDGNYATSQGGAYAFDAVTKTVYGPNNILPGSACRGDNGTIQGYEQNSNGAGGTSNVNVYNDLDGNMYTLGGCSGATWLFSYTHPFDSAIALHALEPNTNAHFGWDNVAGGSDYLVMPPPGDSTKRDLIVYEPGAEHSGDPSPKINRIVGLKNDHSPVFEACTFTNRIPAALSSQDEFFRNYVYDSVLGKIAVINTSNIYAITPDANCVWGSPTWSWGTITTTATDYQGKSCTNNTNCPSGNQGWSTYPRSGYLRNDDAYEECWIFNCWIYKK